jgi:hypothetical protein
LITPLTTSKQAAIQIELESKLNLSTRQRKSPKKGPKNQAGRKFEAPAPPRPRGLIEINQSKEGR